MKFFINLEPHSYRLIKLNTLRSALSEILTSLLVFEGGILSLTVSNDEISLIIRDDVFQEQFQSVNSLSYEGCSGEYLAVTIDTETPGLNETGVLADITKKFAEASISILTFSTYNYNFILYPRCDAEKMERLIEKDDELENYKI